MSHRDLARAAKLSVSYVALLSIKRSWRGVPIDTVERFAQACGVDLAKPWRVKDYLARSKQAHIKNGNVTQRKFFLRLMGRDTKSSG